MSVWRLWGWGGEEGAFARPNFLKQKSVGLFARTSAPRWAVARQLRRPPPPRFTRASCVEAASVLAPVRLGIRPGLCPPFHPRRLARVTEDASRSPPP